MKFPEVEKQTGGGNGIGSGSYLKMTDGQKVQGVFMGDPHIFRQHWPRGGSKSICQGREACAVCKSGDKAKFRFAINFVTKVDGVWQAKVFEQSYGAYLDLKEMHEGAYDLPTTLVTISRSGTEKDTRYRVMPVKDNGGLKPEHFKKLAAIPLNELVESAATPAPEEPAIADDDITF